MPRRTKPAPAPERRSSCSSLLVIDDRPIRRKSMRDCRSALRQREKARLEWERFERRDRPAFERWLHAEFGRHLTELREVEHQTFEAENLVRAVEIEAVMSGTPAWEAYDRVMRAREAPPEEEDGFAEDEGAAGPDGPDDFEDPFAEMGGDPMRELEDELKEFFRKMFGGAGEAGEGGDARSGRRPAPAAPKPSARIKQVYRKLVRRLHPDRIDEMDEVKQDLWHAVQEAYRTRNLEQLESLLARCDLEEGVVSESTPVSQMRTIWRQIKNGVNSLRAQIRKARKDPAWGWTRQSPEQVDARRRRIRQELTRELREQTALRDDLQKEIARWEESRKRWQEAGTSRGSSRARRRSADPFGF